MAETVGVTEQLIEELWGRLTPDMGTEAWEEAVLRLAGKVKVVAKDKFGEDIPGEFEIIHPAG